jgi:hypothetical protein
MHHQQLQDDDNFYTTAAPVEIIHDSDSAQASRVQPQQHAPNLCQDASGHEMTVLYLYRCKVLISTKHVKISGKSDIGHTPYDPPLISHKVIISERFSDFKFSQSDELTSALLVRATF